jgi:SagB-type dehydrogenase family enzyme
MRWIVSAYTVFLWRSGRLHIMSTTSGASFETNNLDLIHLIHAFAEPHTVEEVVGSFNAFEPEKTSAVIDTLIRSGILTHAPESEAAAVHHWDWSALAYHKQSRQRVFQKTSEHGTVPAVASRRSEDTIPLVHSSAEPASDFAKLLESRRSWRCWPATQITHEIFSRFLWLSGRNRSIEGMGTPDEYVSRPYPSGGAAYSLEIYPVISPAAVESIDGGLYRYLPQCHSLEPVTSDDAAYLPLLETAGQSAGVTAPPIVLIITSRFARQSENYGKLAYSLILKEVGCLFQTFYLVAEHLGLGGCALGGGTSGVHFAHLCNTTELAEPIVGEFMVGPR